MSDQWRGSLDPNFTAEQLAQLAAERPDLWTAIAAHPNAYEALRQWIAERQYEAAQAEQAALAAQATPNVQVPSAAPTGYSPAAPLIAAAPQGSQPVKVGRTSTVVIAAVLASVLALAGGGTALALNGTFDSWLGGKNGGALGGTSSGASTASEPDAPLTLANGIEEKWSVTTEELGGQLLIGGWGGIYPKGFNYDAPVKGHPIPFTGGAVVPYATASDDVIGLSLLAADDGDVIWNEIFDRGGVGCESGVAGDKVYCLVETNAHSVLLTFDGEGLAERAEIEGTFEDIFVDVHGVSVAGQTSAARFSAGGKLQWQKPLGLDMSDSGFVLVEAAAERTLVRSYPAGWELFDQNGNSVALEQGEAGGQAGLGGALLELRCDAAIAGGYLFTSGTCDQGFTSLEVLHTGEVPSVRYALPAPIAGEPEMYVALTDGAMTIYNAETGATVSEFSGWKYYMTMARVGSDRALLATPGGEPPATFVDFKNGTLDRGELPDLGTSVAVYEDVIVSITGDYVGMSFVGLDPESGAVRWEMPIENLGVAAVNGLGILTAGGMLESGAIHTIHFFGPTAVPDFDADIAYAVSAKPGNVPDCPTGTLLLAWAEVPDGWVLVCGYSVNQPAYVAYKLPGQKQVGYSAGSEDPSGDEASSAVVWDPALKRYSAKLSNGNILTLDYDMATATVHDGSGEKVLGQHRTVRYIFVPLGQKIQTVNDASGNEGAFSVPTPEDTAEDQVRYMVEVLEKAYEGRALVKEALPKLQNCAAGVGGYEDTVLAMETVRDNRAELLSALSSMPVNKIPEGQALLDDLREGIKVSHAANVEYVKWAKDANANGCGSLSSAGQAAVNASDAPKERFAARWNRVVVPAHGVRSFDPWFI